MQQIKILQQKWKGAGKKAGREWERNSNRVREGENIQALGLTLNLYVQLGMSPHIMWPLQCIFCEIWHNTMAILRVQHPLVVREYSAITAVDFCEAELNDYAVTSGSRVSWWALHACIIPSRAGKFLDYWFIMVAPHCTNREWERDRTGGSEREGGKERSERQ